MAGWGMANGSMRHAASVLLLAGGLVLGVSTPSLAATPLGSKAGASCGCMEPPPHHPLAAARSGSDDVATDGEVIALGSKPGASSGIGLGNPPPRPN